MRKTSARARLIRPVDLLNDHAAGFIAAQPKNDTLAAAPARLLKMGERLRYVRTSNMDWIHQPLPFSHAFQSLVKMSPSPKPGLPRYCSHDSFKWLEWL